MMKLAKIFLALALFTATTGVTVSGFACTKQSEMDAGMCMARNHAKSCCVCTVKHLSVTSQFAKPVQSNAGLQVVLLLAARRPACSVKQDVPLASHSNSFSATPPRTSREYCALASTFRI